MRVTYFDTISPALDLCLLESGYLFAAGDCSDHCIYRFLSLGIDSSKRYSVDSSRQFDDTKVGTDLSGLVRFCPSNELQNLEECDRLPNFGCVTDMIVADLAGIGENQIYLSCGKSNRGSLRQLTHGLTVIEMATSGMPLKPTRVMTLRNRRAGEDSNLYDDFMIVSFAESSLILSIREGKISSVQDSGFTKSEPTLHAAVLEDGSYVQVTTSGIVHVRSHIDPTLKNTTWQCDPKRQVVHACSNSRQVVVQIGSDQIIYFELDLQQGGVLVEKGQQIFKQPVRCLSLAPVPAGRMRFKFLIAGFADSTVRVLSLEPESCLDRVSVQALPSAPSAVLLSEINDHLLLHIGLENGVLLRTVVDAVTGGMSDSRSKFLGISPISLAEIRTNGQQAVLALSDKPFVCFYHQNQYTVAPLSYEALEHVCSFSSTQCFEGIVGIKGKELRII